MLLIVVLLALTTYATIRAIERRGVIPADRTRRRAAPPRPQTRPMAPDDDDDFLRDLDRARKKRHPDDPVS